MYGVDKDEIKAMGITNQRETMLLWDKETGQPLHKAIVWQDARTKDTCDMLRSQYSNARVQKISGLPISTYFSGVKLRWLLDNVPEVRKAVDDRTALFGTIDTWLVWSLTGKKSHVTDVTNAGRTMLMNIETLQWDPELMAMIGVTSDILPDIRSCSENFGTLELSILKGKPITGLIGDQQSALVGQAAFKVGEGKNTYGTGCFFIVNTGLERRTSKHQLLTTPAYKFGDKDCVYSLEGSVAIGGAAVSWLKKIGLIESAGEMEKLAGSVENTEDTWFVPAFSGFLAPRWREDARGALVGLTQATTKAHIARATLEGIAHKVNEVLTAAAEDMGEPLTALRVDGGASVNNLLMQMQSDFSNVNVMRPKNVETTALGAAFAAGLKVGMFKSEEAFRKSWSLDREFQPLMSPEQRKQRLDRWEEAVQKSLGWVGEPIKSSVITKNTAVIALVAACVGSVVTLAVCRALKK